MDICEELEAQSSTVHGGAFSVMRKAIREIKRLRGLLATKTSSPGTSSCIALDLDALEHAAAEATQGKWWHRTAPGRQGFVQVTIHDSTMPYGLELLGEDYTGFGEDEQREKDCAFVAAANPAVVLELIRRLRLAEKGVSR